MIPGPTHVGPVFSGAGLIRNTESPLPAPPVPQPCGTEWATFGFLLCKAREAVAEWADASDEIRDALTEGFGSLGVGVFLGSKSTITPTEFVRIGGDTGFFENLSDHLSQVAGRRNAAALIIDQLFALLREICSMIECFDQANECAFDCSQVAATTTGWLLLPPTPFSCVGRSCGFGDRIEVVVPIADEEVTVLKQPARLASDNDPIFGAMRFLESIFNTCGQTVVCPT